MSAGVPAYGLWLLVVTNLLRLRGFRPPFGDGQQRPEVASHLVEQSARAETRHATA